MGNDDTSDIVAITQLVGRYNQAIDSGDGAAYAACFVADGALVGPGMEHRGTEALSTFAAAVPGQVPGVRHWVNNLVVDVDGDAAASTCYLLLVVGGAPPTTIASGRYWDTLRKGPDGWRFVERRFAMDAAPGS